MKSFHMQTHCSKCNSEARRYCEVCRRSFSYRDPVKIYKSHLGKCGQKKFLKEKAQDKIQERMYHIEEEEGDDLEEEEDVNSDIGIPRVITAEVSRRDPAQQKAFRLRLWRRDKACVVSGCCLRNAVDAAHISGSWLDGYELSNGLLLRKDLHALFDLFEWSINEAGIVVLGREMLADPTYQQFNNQQLQLPAEVRKQLAEHYSLFYGNQLLF